MAPGAFVRTLICSAVAAATVSARRIDDWVAAGLPILARNGAALDLLAQLQARARPCAPPIYSRASIARPRRSLQAACSCPRRVVPRSAACLARSGHQLVNYNLHRFVRARRRPRCTSAGCLGTPVSVWASPRPPAPRSRLKVGGRCALGCGGGGGSWGAAAAAAACRCLTSSAACRPCHCTCRTRQWTGDKARWAVGLALAGQAQA